MDKNKIRGLKMNKIYLTKTGIELTVIQGEGQGNGIPAMRGMLKVLTEQDAIDRQNETEFIEKRKAKKRPKNYLQSRLGLIMGLIKLKLSQGQLAKCTSSDDYDWANQVRKVSKSKAVLDLCDELQNLIDDNFFELYNQPDEGA